MTDSSLVRLLSLFPPVSLLVLVLLSVFTAVGQCGFLGQRGERDNSEMYPSRCVCLPLHLAKLCSIFNVQVSLFLFVSCISLCLALYFSRLRRSRIGFNVRNALLYFCQRTFLLLFCVFLCGTKMLCSGFPQLGFTKLGHVWCKYISLIQFHLGSIPRLKLFYYCLKVWYV